MDPSSTSKAVSHPQPEGPAKLDGPSLPAGKRVEHLQTWGHVARYVPGIKRQGVYRRRDQPPVAMIAGTTCPTGSCAILLNALVASPISPASMAKSSGTTSSITRCAPIAMPMLLLKRSKMAVGTRSYAGDSLSQTPS